MNILSDNRFDKLYFFSTANLMNPVMVMQQPQEFDPYINARAASYQGSQYGSRYNNNNKDFSLYYSKIPGEPFNNSLPTNPIPLIHILQKQLLNIQIE